MGNGRTRLTFYRYMQLLILKSRQTIQHNKRMRINGSQESVKRRQHSDLPFVILMVISMVIWGGSWVSAKVVAMRLTPEVLCFWRFLLSFSSLLPLVVLRKEFVITGPGMTYGLLGAILMSAYMYFFFRGLEHELAGAAGVLVTSMIPLMTLVLSLILFRKKEKSRDIAGLGLGILGAAILLKIWTFDLNVLFYSDNLVFLFCAVLWAILTICSQRAARTISPYMFSLITYGMSAIIFLPSAMRQEIGVVFSQDALFWANMFFLSVISAGFATTVYFIAAERLGSYRTSSYVFVVPTSAVLLSWLFLDETPQLQTIAGGIIAIAAVYLINHTPTHRKQAATKSQ